MLETPNRVAKSYQDFFSGYDEDPREILSKKFREVEGYDEMIVLKVPNLEVEELLFRTCVVVGGVPKDNGSGNVQLKIAAVLNNIG